MTTDAGTPRRQPGLGQPFSVVAGSAAEGSLVPPQALEAERGVLAAMLLSPEAVARAIESIDAKVFYRGAHQKMFEAMVALFDRNEKIDLITLSEELRKRGDLETIGGVAAVSQIEDYASTPANVEQYIRIVHSKAILRALIDATREIQGEAYAGSDESSSILDRAEQRIFKITDQRVRQGFIMMKDLMMPTMKTIEELHERKALVTGVPSGYEDLDKMTAGFQKSDLVIIAGRPSMGKCLAKDSELVLDDGSIATIEELVRRRDSRVGTLRDDLKLDRATPSAFVDDGMKPVYEVTTRLGRRVETTLPHPFLTLDGWKPLAELEVGDYVAVPRVLPVFGNEAMRECEIKLIASGIGNSGPARIANEAASPPIAVGATVGTGCAVIESSTETAVARAAGVAEADTQVPAPVFRLPRAQLASFLRHLFAAGGSATVLGPGGGQIEYSTTSERLARQVAHLLLRFGVIARLRSQVSRPEASRVSWRLDIQDASSIDRFLAEIGIHGELASVAALRRSLESGSRPTDGDRFISPTIDVYWDRIESIVPAGIKQVYDLTIPETHNFIANDVCVHNTSFAMNIAENASIQHGKNVAVLSLEMSKEQIALRLMCSQSEVPLHRVRSGHLSESEFRRLANLTGGLYKASIVIDDTAAPTVLEIRAKCRRLKAENRLDMVIIDYLQLIRASGRSENRNQEISLITRSMKGLAKELDIPIIALSQLSRAPEGRGVGDRRPQLSDLRESGSIEQDADVVLFVFREEMYKRDDPSLRGKADIIIAKQRNGPTGDVKLTFLHEFTKFVPYSPVMPGETDPGF